jgi:hypothetical protein
LYDIFFIDFFQIVDLWSCYIKPMYIQKWFPRKKINFIILNQLFQWSQSELYGIFSHQNCTVIKNILLLYLKIYWIPVFPITASLWYTRNFSCILLLCIISLKKEQWLVLTFNLMTGAKTKSNYVSHTVTYLTF